MADYARRRDLRQYGHRQRRRRIYYRTGSVCQLYSGKIENNKASGNGGGIYINPSNSGQLRIGNKPLVQNNTVSGKANNVYLPPARR